MKKLLYIGNKLSKKGSNLTTIETLGKLLEEEGFVVEYASEKKHQLSRLLDMIFTTISNCSVDYVLIDTYSTSGFWFCLIVSQICRVFKIKYIPILHGGNLPNRLNKNPFLCNLIFNHSYRNIAPSRYLLEAFVKKGYSNIEHIPNSIEIEKYKFSERKFDFPRLLWVRSFSAIYNPKMAIKVLSELRKRYPLAQLCMIGPDNENLISDCKLYAKELNVDVDFKGKLSVEEWSKLSEEFNVFINTTHFDNTPVSIIEAMALGLPVVSTNVGGIPFLLKHNYNALLVNDTDTDAMKDEIVTFFTNENKAIEIQKNARKTVEQFDWKIVRNIWIQVLK